MENKILELLEQKGSVSMNDDIFPLVEKEFEGQVIGAELYELAHQYISQLEWCRQWSEEHKKKMTRKMQKKIRRVQHWCNCKLYVKYAWYEFRAMVKG